MVKNYKATTTILLAISLVAAFGLFFANSASASTLTISATCIDDDIRVSKNGSIVYDGTNVLDCGAVTTTVDAGCDDKIKIDIKDNAVVEVGFGTITLSHDGYTKTLNKFLYFGSWVDGQSSYLLNKQGRPKQSTSYYPTTRYYNTEVDGTKTLRELGLCATVQPACSSVSDCGTNGYTGSAFCNGNNVYQKYVTYTCNNAGAASAYCSSSTTDQLKTTCGTNQTCSNGSCVDQNITCNSNSACGTDSYIGSPFCQGNNVYQNYITYTCNNAGTANSYCSNSTSQKLKTTCGTNQTCSNGSCSNQNITCSSSSDCGTSGYTGSQFCNGNNVYQNYVTYTCNNAGTANSYCSNSTSQQLKTTCYGNQTCNNGYCSGNNCTQNAYQRCNGNNLYWYDSCGNLSNLSQYCPNGCYNNTCQYYNNASNLYVNRTVKNLTTNSGWSTSINASPSDILMFMTTIQASGSEAQNVTVRDYLPSGLIYNKQLTVSSTSGSYYNYSGTPTTGLYLNTIPAGQTVTVTYQAQVADAGNFSYGSTTLNATSSITSSNGSNPTSSTPITVTRAAVYGASTISTGLTNNILVDSFFLPALITLLAIWMWKAGLFFGIEKWLGNKKQTRRAYSSEKELANRITEIQETETI